MFQTNNSYSGTAMEVKVVSGVSSTACPEADYVRVEICSDPEQDTVTLATIERVVHKSNAKPSGPMQRVKTLLQKQPMSLRDALGFATRYAERKQISLVLSAAPDA